MVLKTRLLAHNEVSYLTAHDGTRIQLFFCHRKPLHRGKTPFPLPNKCTVYPKQSDGETPVILELLGMRCTSSLPSLPGQLWPGLVAPDRALSMVQIELNYVLILN